MTKQQWLACTDPDTMLEFLGDNASDRKLRLFACACRQRLWSLQEEDRKRMLVNNWSELAVEMAKKEANKDKNAVELAEKYADGQVGIAELKAIYRLPEEDEYAAASAAGLDAAWTAKASAYHARHLAMYFSPSSYPPGAEFRSPSKVDHDRERSAQCNLLHDIFNNPFRPITLDPNWLTPTVVSMALEIYDSRKFDRLPLLADTLEQAGCNNAEILNHSRDPGPHVRGCWVVDGTLGRG